MADSTPISRRRANRAPGSAAFTLVELLVSLGVSAFVLTGVLGATLQLARSSVRVTQYAEMDTQVRRAFEQLASDLKSASNLTWNSATDVTFTTENSDGTSTVFTYAWNSSTQQFYYVPGADSSVLTGRVQLVAGATALAFARLDSSGNAALTDNATKQVRVTLTLKRSAVGSASSSSTVSTKFMLRNKPVS